jgi:hypothetical protein
MHVQAHFGTPSSVGESRTHPLTFFLGHVNSDLIRANDRMTRRRERLLVAFAALAWVRSAASNSGDWGMTAPHATAIRTINDSQ